MNLSQLSREDQAIVAALGFTQTVKVQYVAPFQTITNFRCEQTITDNVLVVIAKEMEYIQTLTGYTRGFIFKQAKKDYLEQVSIELIPIQYYKLWNFISTSELKKCKNIKNFLQKMLSSKDKHVARQFYQVYFEVLENILHINHKFSDKQFTERQITEFSKLFAKNFVKRIVKENQYNQFLSIDEKYISIALLSRGLEVKEIYEFQEQFPMVYTKWKTQLTHLIQVIHYSLQVEYYDLPVNYFYEGYFKNTEFKTERGQPKFQTGQ